MHHRHGRTALTAAALSVIAALIASCTYHIHTSVLPSQQRCEMSYMFSVYDPVRMPYDHSPRGAASSCPPHNSTPQTVKEDATVDGGHVSPAAAGSGNQDQRGDAAGSKAVGPAAAAAAAAVPGGSLSELLPPGVWEAVNHTGAAVGRMRADRYRLWRFSGESADVSGGGCGAGRAVVMFGVTVRACGRIGVGVSRTKATPGRPGCALIAHRVWVAHWAPLGNRCVKVCCNGALGRVPGACVLGVRWGNSPHHTRQGRPPNSSIHTVLSVPCRLVA